MPLLKRVLCRTGGLLRQTRHFSLAKQDATTFLQNEIGLEALENGNSSLLSIVLHADRRPKLVNGNRTFGPALLACRIDKLGKGERNLGPGDLGVMQLQRHSPKQVQDVPIAIKDGLNSKACQTAIEQLIHGKEANASDITARLQTFWNLFESCRGVWFSFQLDSKARVISPFLEFDDFAVKRMPESLQRLYSNRPRDENAARAEDGGLFYIKLPGNGSIGTFGYGAGNAMATMDGVANAGGSVANFLDGGGGANRENAKLAIETLDRDSDVKSIFVNTFGGLTQTDVVAQGIIDAVKEHSIEKPITIRILGTGSEQAQKLLRDSGLQFTIEDNFDKAAQIAVQQSMK